MPRLTDRYQTLIQSGRFERDPAQERVIEKLDALAARLEGYRPAKKAGALGWLFAARPSEPICGVYIRGPVGRGKTMLMDMFFETAQVQRKRRVHFHSFMADVHARIHAWREERKGGRVNGEDPIAPVAEALASETWLLCFDEFTVSDIADAMLLGRLFAALFEHGVVVVATSNVDPDDLYKDGLNRALFLPFLDLLRQHMEVVRLEARTDFRLEKLRDSSVYCVPADDRARAALQQAFESLTGRPHGSPTTLRVLGHPIAVPEAAANVARFSFADLCEKPLGATDFLAVARAFHTIVLDDIPIIQANQRNEAKRFINLIDALYDRHVKLIASAAAEPQDLYLGQGNREAFEFERTASRLIEMRSPEYLAMPHTARAGEGDLSGVVET
ncbi:MAG: cell division protein ZapE [Methylobacteriaceae bacterium]|nr:cell division protein ZapE [Methylobacteriaceae bacterium]